MFQKSLSSQAPSTSQDVGEITNEPRSPPSAINSIPLSPLQHALSGGMAGVVSRFFIAPFDVIKIHLQLQTSARRPRHLTHSNPLTSTSRAALGATFKPSHLPYEGILPFVKRTIHREGLKGLWKGNLSAEYLYLSYGAIQFATYSTVEESLHQFTFLGYQLPQSTVSFVSGFATGIVATMCTYPFDLLRTRFAAQGDVKAYQGFFDSIRAITKSEGIQGFYRGMWPSLVQIMPYISLVFGTYDYSTRWFQLAKERSTLIHYISPFQDIICGGIAGTVGKLGVFPLDVVRKRLQVQGPSRKLFAREQVPVYSSSVWRTIREIALHEGIQGLYRGLVPGLVKSAPASAITFFIYGQMQRACDEYNKRNPQKIFP